MKKIFAYSFFGLLCQNAFCEIGFVGEVPTSAWEWNETLTQRGLSDDQLMELRRLWERETIIGGEHPPILNDIVI